MMLGKTSAWKILLAVGAVAVSACSAPSEETAASGDSIIGGVPVTSAKLDAVGSLQLQLPGDEERQSFCTGTLIAPNVVLTAKHCSQIRTADGATHWFTELGKVYFGVGNDGANPTKLVEAERADASDLNEGGGPGLGSDVAVYFLKTPVDGVTPIPLADKLLAEADQGASYVAIGYGVRNAAGESGVRTMGNITLKSIKGSAMEAAWGTFEAFKENIEKQIGRPLTEEESVQVKEIFERPMLEGHEAVFAAKDGDVQPCNGDSGGPLLRVVDDKLQVFGVASWVPNKSATDALCKRGVVYATMGPGTATLLDRAACNGEKVEGRCDGNTAIRCVTRSEGGPRITQTRCGELGLVCGQIEGKAGCVEATTSNLE